MYPCMIFKIILIMLQEQILCRIPDTSCKDFMKFDFIFKYINYLYIKDYLANQIHLLFKDQFILNRDYFI